jgi:hypothetical protein
MKTVLGDSAYDRYRIEESVMRFWSPPLSALDWSDEEEAVIGGRLLVRTHRHPIWCTFGGTYGRLSPEVCVNIVNSFPQFASGSGCREVVLNMAVVQYLDPGSFENFE